MSDYFNKTEEQEFNDVKNWFKANGTPILLATLVAVGATFGWNYWKNHQIEVAQQNSQQYQAVMESYLQDPSKNAPLAEKFIADHKESSYAVFTQLELAKQAVEKGDFSAAKTQLQTALSASSDATLQNVIRFRLASVSAELKAYDEALAELGKIQDKAWSLRKQILTGDILLAKGDKAAAKSAYEQAKQALPAGQDNTLIELRLNNL